MNQNVLELPSSIYQALLKAAQETDTTPVGWIAAHLPGLREKSVPRNTNGMIPKETEEQAGRIQELAYYLGTVCNAGDISSTTASAALRAWNDLHKAVGCLPVPDAAPGPDGQLLYTWNRAEHHLELEIYPTQPAEFFYYNRATEETWEDTYTVGDPLSEEVQNRLSAFTQAHD